MTRPPTEGWRDTVEVRELDGETALCPAEAVLRKVEGENKWLLYTPALLDEEKYVLHIDDQTWPVLLRRAESKAPPAIVILIGFPPPLL